MEQMAPLQQALSQAPEPMLREALQANVGLPQVLVMMELNNRRVQGPMGPIPRQTMRDEMAAGAYQPVPTPPFVPLPKINNLMNSGIMSPPGQVHPQATHQADPSQNAGLGSLFRV